MVKYQFEMPLEEHVFGKNIFWTALIGKIRERKKLTSHIILLSYQLTSTANPVLMGQIGCAGWLVARKAIMQIQNSMHFLVSFTILKA